MSKLRPQRAETLWLLAAALLALLLLVWPAWRMLRRRERATALEEHA